jgi:spermidine dehydrogenase
MAETEKFTRRDFLNGTLLASGAALVSAVCPFQLMAAEDWNGESGIGDYAGANGNTYQVMADGHVIRDHSFDRTKPAIEETGESYDCVIVGGGISGLAAALFYKRAAGARRSCLVLENHPIFGGEAKRNEFNVDGQRLIASQGRRCGSSHCREVFSRISTIRWESIRGSFSISRMEAISRPA